MLNVAKNNYRTNRKKSNIYTPMCIIDFLYSIIPDKYLGLVFDPACGDGRLLRGKANIGYDIDLKARPTDPPWLYENNDFFSDQILEKVKAWPKLPDLIINNPPFNHKKEGRDLLPEKFLKRIIELWGNKMPVILFSPIGLLANQRIDSSRWRWMRETVNITSIVSLPLDIFTPVGVMLNYKEFKKELEKNETPETHKETLIELKVLRREMGVIEFHTEIICLNIPELKPHYFLPRKHLL